MQREVTEDDGIYYLSPAVAEKFNISQDYKFDAEFKFHGRGGKHLCLTRFEGYSLKLSNNELVTILASSGKQGDETDQEFPNRLCSLLLAYLTECEKIFSQQRIAESFAYNQRFEAQRILESVWPEAEAKYEKHKAKKAKLKAKLLNSLTAKKMENQLQLIKDQPPQVELLITVESGCVVDVSIVQVSNLREELLLRVRVLDLDNEDNHNHNHNHNHNQHIEISEEVNEWEEDKGEGEDEGEVEAKEDVYEFKFNNQLEVCN